MQEAILRPRAGAAWNPRSLLGTPNPSLMDSLLPSAVFWQRLAIALLFIGLLVALGRARFYLPDNPIPITLQTFGVLLTGGVLGFRWGMFSVLGWYFLGMAGVPVFQGGGNGWAYVSGGYNSSGQQLLTGGYLIGIIACVALIGFLSQRGWTHSRTLWPILLGALIIYLPGVTFLAAFSESLNLGNMLSVGMYPFIPGDLVKLMGASMLTGALWILADRRRGGS